ncbi:hypothetical protein LTR36_003834 [Oleoguttula mirabilis]|uniref:Major facilitator superfamily (MFS) profile domain-containing protein n=1 Tax=Oleoguttula mirabilis TaxID=1507867 RepID=A0AAV9JHP7_9PEZI|nr:hypothetical protein LTR36_003834 [Oleoguttula mirabilis]
MAKATARAYDTNALPPAAHLASPTREMETDDPYKLPPLSFDRSPLGSLRLGPRPRASLGKLSSLDNIIMYREEKAEWKRASSISQQGVSETALDAAYDDEQTTHPVDQPRYSAASDEKSEVRASGTDTPSSSKQQSTFRHFAGEVGFCFTIAMTQFLAEYLISGFAVELPRIFDNRVYFGTGSLGLFWPASLLSLILSATLLIFARLSDMYGGYPCFMFGTVWLTIWTLIPGFCNSLVMVDVARAMQGLAIAAFSPATFALIGSFYADGPRKNFVLGLYSGCAPLGFFAGFLTAGALPESKYEWYFWIASALSAVTTITAFLTVPHDKTDRKQLGLKMDWSGSFLITAGLILTAYALAVEPYTFSSDPNRNGFNFPIVYGPFCSGIVCIALAVWVEGWLATCPLLPLDFFRPRSVKAFCLAALCFYASYSVWLYNSSQYFQSTAGVTGPDGISGIQLAIWYTPTAIGGLILCVIGGAVLHIVPIEMLLLLSGLAWIAAPLLLAVCPLPLNYWAVVMPSMVCATLGIDLTYTVSLVFFSAVQPKRYQGLCGAVCSILVNLAMSFALPISEIVTKRAESGPFAAADSASSQEAVMAGYHRGEIWGFQAAFIYGAASAGLGFAICALFVRIPRSVVGEKKPVDEERPRETSSEASTLVEDRHAQQDEETPVQSSELDR